MSDTWKLVPVEPDKLMLVKGENALHSSSHGDFHATEGEIEACYLAMLDAAPAPPVPSSVQEIMRLMNGYVRACVQFEEAGRPLESMLEEDVADAFEPLETALRVLVDDNHRLKFELAGVRAMRGPLTDEQIRAVMESVDFTYEPTRFARAIEKAHGIEPEQGDGGVV